MMSKLGKIVVIGGGSGSAVALKGLVKKKLDISVIVTMFDSGGSSGKLRDEFGLLPVGDIRQCLLALSNSDKSSVKGMVDVLNYRFDKDSSLSGHSVGNLVLAALTSIHKDLGKAIRELSLLLNTKGRVIPVTYDQSNLCARLMNGQIIHSESNIDLREESNPAIKEIYLDKPVEVNQDAVKEIHNADLILLGPGDLYTSIIPNFLVPEIKNAIRDTKAKIIYASNLMTKLGETSGYKASKFSSEILGYLYNSKFDSLLLNNSIPPEIVLKAYEKEKAEIVPIDEKVKSYSKSLVIKNFIRLEGTTVRHDYDLLAEEIIKLL